MKIPLYQRFHTFFGPFHTFFSHLQISNQDHNNHLNKCAIRWTVKYLYSKNNPQWIRTESINKRYLNKLSSTNRITDWLVTWRYITGHAPGCKTAAATEYWTIDPLEANHLLKDRDLIHIYITINRRFCIVIKRE